MNPIFLRTSIRSYEARPVEPEKIRLLLQAAMAAPSACNQQPWEFYIADDKETLAKLSECSPYAGCVKHAPLAIIPCARRELPAPAYADIDMSAAVENLLLEARDRAGSRPHGARRNDFKASRLPAGLCGHRLRLSG